MDYTIDGLTPADWVRRQTQHNLHKDEPWTCDECFAKHTFVPLWPNSSVSEPHEFDADACETCWLATK